MAATVAHPPVSAQPAVFDPALVQRFSLNGPRYTSYPTADRFAESFDDAGYIAAMRTRALGAIRQPLSLYVHLPFCNTVCFYCACNKIITGDRSRSAKYIEYLAKEIELQAGLLGEDRRVNHMHWGGGTPTFLTKHELTVLNESLRSAFDFDPAGEYAIEIDPRTADQETMALLASLGFNRTSFGVQDFDPAVQKAVNRIQSYEETRAVIDASRKHGFKSVNVDLIYGLPNQNVKSFTRTLAQVCELRPERIALYHYAHLPSRFKPQRRIVDADVPGPSEKLAILTDAIEAFNAAGYVYIGMDHFALPDDDLAKAQRRGTLTRNFQGYSSGPDGDLLALGVSSIGRIGRTYSQNNREINGYYDALDHGRLPVVRGIELTADDLLRRTVINALMCQCEVTIGSIEASYRIDFASYFAREMDELCEFVELGLVEVHKDTIAVTPRGRYFVRAVAAVFDTYLRANRATQSYSRIV